MIINKPNDLYNLILKEKLNVIQVNEILQSFLIQKSYIVFNDYTPIEIVNLIKVFFETYKNEIEKPIFIDDFEFNINDLVLRENTLIHFK